MFWNIKFKHGLCRETVLEALSEADAKKAGVAFYRYNTTGIDFFKPDDVVESVSPVFDENWSGQTYCCDPKIMSAVRQYRGGNEEKSI